MSAETEPDMGTCLPETEQTRGQVPCLPETESGKEPGKELDKEPVPLSAVVWYGD